MLTILDWILLVAGLLIALYWYLTRHYDYWSSRGVYCLPGVKPGVGHFWDAIRFKKSVHWMYVEFYRQTKNHPAVGLYQFREPALLVRDLDLVQAVLIKDFSSFHDNTVIVSKKIEPYLHKNPFVLKGEEWRTLRQLLAPGFNHAKTKGMFPLLMKVCEEFNNYMEKHLNQNTNVNAITSLFTSEVVAKCAFGFDGKAFTDPDAKFVDSGRKLWTFFFNPVSMLLMLYFPRFNTYVTKRSIMSKDVTDFFISLVKQTWDLRMQNPDQTPDNDYLQFLFNLHKKKPTEFTMNDVVSHILTFFTDGHETSAMVISYTLYELTINPEIQEELRKEVKSMDSFNYENIIALPFLDRVFQETLRKHNSLSFMKRCTKDTVLEVAGHTYPVLKGQRVVIPAYGIHHDPDIYPDPERFDPDRFLPENVKKRHPASYLGFGAGPRVCIGYRFATSTVKVFLANILANFRMVKSDKTVEKITLNPSHFIPVNERGIYISFQKL